MADFRISGTYELASPDPATGIKTSPIGLFSELRYTAGADLGGDVLSFTAEGHYADMAAQAAIAITVTWRLGGERIVGARPRVISLSGFRVASVVESYLPSVSVIQARRVVDYESAAADILAALDARTVSASRFSDRFYPLLQRWDEILRPSGHVADAPTIWRHIADEARRGNQPDYARITETLARFGLEIMTLADIADAPAGYFSLTAGGVPITIIPMNYSAGTAQAVNDYEIDADFAITDSDRADNALTRKMRFSVPTERALFDDKRTDRTVAIYEGGASAPAITLSPAYERPHYGAIALEGERYRRYLTNQTAEATVLEHGARTWNVRDLITMPRALGGGNWIITGIETTINEGRCESAIDLRRARTANAAQVYANSPSPFNAASGWAEIHKPPVAPELLLVNYNPSTGKFTETEAADSPETPIQSNAGGGFIVALSQSSASDPEIDKTHLTIWDGARLESDQLVDGTVAAFAFTNAIANDGETGKVYTARVWTTNEWGESSPRTTMQARMALGQKPTTIINEIIPKRIQEQLGNLPDQLFLEYSGMVDDLKAPYAIDNPEAQHAGILLTGAQLFALNQELPINEEGGDILALLGSFFSLNPATNGLIGILRSGAGEALQAAIQERLASGASLGNARLQSARWQVGRLNMRVFAPNNLLGAVPRIQYAVTVKGLGIASSALRLLSVVGGRISGFLSIASIAYGILVIANSPTSDGAFINLWADGHGYPIQTVKIQRRTRNRDSTQWSAWSEQRTGGFVNPGSAYLLESESNPARTIKRYQQFVPLREAAQATGFMQFRACAITSVNENDEDDALSWATSAIMREQDFGRLWIRIQANANNNGLELVRADSTVPTYPTESGQGGGG